MKTMRGTVGSIATLAVTVALLSTLADSPALSCPEVKIDPATGQAMTATDMRAALQALTEEQEVAEATR